MHIIEINLPYKFIYWVHRDVWRWVETEVTCNSLLLLFHIDMDSGHLNDSGDNKPHATCCPIKTHLDIWIVIIATNSPTTLLMNAERRTLSQQPADTGSRFMRCNIMRGQIPNIASAQGNPLNHFSLAHTSFQLNAGRVSSVWRKLT